MQGPFKKARNTKEQIRENSGKSGEMRGGSIFERGFRDSVTKPF